MMSRTVLGDAVTVPPMKELSGAQSPAVPFVTAPVTWPLYLTSTPLSVPRADPGEPIVALVQLVQAVIAKAGTAEKANTPPMAVPVSVTSLPIIWRTEWRLRMVDRPYDWKRGSIFSSSLRYQAPPH